MNTVTAYQKAVAANMIEEYLEAIRGYFTRTNYSAIDRAFKALPPDVQAAAVNIQDGRYVI